LQASVRVRRCSLWPILAVMSKALDHDRLPLPSTGGLVLPRSGCIWACLVPSSPELDEEGRPLPPPYRVLDNPATLLDVSDLVFIDPVNTGYSRPVPGEQPRRFHGFTPDIESVGDFIRLYVTRNQRWLSPKFLIGESYGTTRAGGLAGYLQERHGLYLNGLMLVSTVLNFQTLAFHPGNDLPYVLFLPTYTATAFFHQRLPEDLQRDLRTTLAEVEAFALGDYAAALMQGSALGVEQRAQIIERLARYTGLSPVYIEGCDLRIRDNRFVKELLRSVQRSVGRLDSRFTGIDRDSVGEKAEYDPSLAAIAGPYTAALNAYVREELGFQSDLPYEILSPRVHPWSFSDHENRYVDVSEILRAAICVNPALQVYVASGYYDLATPYCATNYTLNHLGLERSLISNIRVSYFEAGHMMYIHRPSLLRLKRELAAFVLRAGSRS
jgi:carboxypeptidase C (cathepsin A)